MTLNCKACGKLSSRLAIILIILITALVYANSLRNSFIWDDFLTIVNNDSIKSWHNFPVLFSKSYLISFGEETYRPVETLSNFIDYSIWKLNPFGYHLTNVLLHILNAALIYHLINLIVCNRNLALLTALLFALHPVNTEAVNGISFREDLLALVFYLSSLILYIRSRKPVLSLIFFALALFSKEIALTLPGIIILYDYFFVFDGNLAALIKDFRARYLGIKSRYPAFILVLLLYVGVRFFLMNNPVAARLTYPGGNFYTNILTMSRAFVHYIYLAFFPINAHLILHGNSFISNSFFTPKVFFSVLFLLFCFFAANRIKKTSKELSFSIYWFFLTLIPVSNILPLNNFLANRFLYIPMVGFCFFLAALLFKMPHLEVSFFKQGLLQKFSRCAIIVLLLFYPAFTMIRNLRYRNSISLWSEMVDIYPDSFEAHSLLGYGFLSNGLFDKAIQEYNTAISLTPFNIPTDDYEYLGACYYDKGMPDKAVEVLNKALQINSHSEKACLYLGIIFKDKRAYGKAIEYFKRAVYINPKCAQANKELSSIKALIK